MFCINWFHFFDHHIHVCSTFFLMENISTDCTEFCLSSENRVPTPTTPSSTRGKAGRNHLNVEITPSARRVIQPSHIKFRTCSALAPMWTPPINEIHSHIHSKFHSYNTLIHLHSTRPLSVFFIAFAQRGKPPWGAEPGFELRPAVQQASALPTELCCTLVRA